jgi:integrase/recombinase XerD
MYHRGVLLVRSDPQDAGLISRFEEHMRSRGLAQATTVHNRICALRRIEAEMRRPLVGVTTAEISAHLARRAAELRRGSLAQEHSHLAEYFKFLQLMDIRVDNPMLKLRRPKGDTAPPTPMLAEDFRAMMGVLADPRDRALMALAREAGLRRAEIASLPWAGIRRNGELSVTGKGQRTRILPVTLALEASLDELPGARRGYVIASDTGRPWSPNLLGRHANGLLQPWGVTLHCLRHAFAVAMYEATGDLEQVRRALGHTSIVTTQRYVEGSTAGIAAGVRAASWCAA